MIKLLPVVEYNPVDTYSHHNLTVELILFVSKRRVEGVQSFPRLLPGILPLPTNVVGEKELEY